MSDAAKLPSAEDGSRYEVIAVRYASLHSTERSLYAAHEVYGTPDRPVVMDYFFWIVRNAARTVVVDTGFDPEVGRRRGREVVCTPREALARLGVSPDSVSAVVLSHFHYDHIGNVGLFPGTRLVAARSEADFWTGPYGARPVAAAPVESAEIAALAQARRDGRLDLLPDKQLDIPGLDVVDLAGHTPGQLGVRVATATGSVVLAADAAHFYDEFERDMPFHVFTDLVGMYRSLESLRALAATPGTVVVPGHDPDVMRRFRPLTAAASGVGVQIA